MHGELMPEPELESYCLRLRESLPGGQIKEVHAYTVARPTPEPFATSLTQSEWDLSRPGFGARLVSEC